MDCPERYLRIIMFLGIFFLLGDIGNVTDNRLSAFEVYRGNRFEYPVDFSPAVDEPEFVRGGVFVIQHFSG